MDKNTKILLGVAGLALVAYFLWEKSSKDATNDAAKSTTKTNFVSANGLSGSPCSFKMDGEIISGKVSELDNKYCFSTDGKRGLAI
jgi:hypothetical protein